jgi:hypothetical protein
MGSGSWFLAVLKRPCFLYILLNSCIYFTRLISIECSALYSMSMLTSASLRAQSSASPE